MHQISRSAGPGAHCHHLIASTAKEMAGSMYDDMALDNAFYAQCKRQGVTRGKFIAKLWPTLLEQARSTLADMLTIGPDSPLKETISDALIKDKSLRG